MYSHRSRTPCRVLHDRSADLGIYSVKGVGYGAGTRNPAKIPNVIRAMIVETTGDTGPMTSDTVDILETNVDDVSGEVIANAITRFLEAGARDASAITDYYEKRETGFPYPGYLLQREECGTCRASWHGNWEHSGIRCFPAVHRFIAERTIEHG